MSRHAHDHSHENAMTEIALALAMGFFSLMVLTLISMGAGENTPLKHEALVLAPLSDKPSSGAQEIDQDDLILIYDGERFLDTNLNVVDPETLIQNRSDSSQRVILALAPDLSLERAIKARGLVQVENLIVSSLDNQWLEALKIQGRVK